MSMIIMLAFQQVRWPVWMVFGVRKLYQPSMHGDVKKTVSDINELNSTIHILRSISR